jgi:exodeoxyribonuclease VII small subunit
MDFEQAMKRLTEISELMGKSDLKLEDSMKLYTEAVELTKKCKEYINAELQVQTLEASN